MNREQFIQSHSSLFWYIPREKRCDVSDSLLIETILNEGTMDDYRELLAILGPRRVAEVFFGASEREVKNYYPEIRNFFSIVLSKYAQ